MSEATTTTSTEISQPVSQPAKAPKASKGKKSKQQVAPKQATPANPMIEQRNALLDMVNGAVASTKGKSQAEAVATLSAALAKVHESCPDVVLSENKEQRIAQLKHLRETRANLGWQVAARILNDAIASIAGAEQSRKFSARVLVNGGLSATETVRTTIKTNKGKKGLAIR